MNVLLFLFSLFSFIPLQAKMYSEERAIVNYLKEIKIEEPKSGLELIDCLYVINLDERPEKWARVKKLLNEKGVHPNRVSAVNGWKISKEDQEKLAGAYPVRMVGGHLGCLLSHLSILKDASKRGFQTIWICEDDIEVVDSLDKIPTLLKELKGIDPDWEVFYTDIDMRVTGGYYFHSFAADYRPDQPHLSEEHYRRRSLKSCTIMEIGQRYGMHSVIFSQKGIKKVLDYYTHTDVWGNIDIDMHYIPGIRQYSVTHDIVTNAIENIVSDTSSDPNINKVKN